MSPRFLLATRKGLFTLSRDGGGWSVTGPEFLGVPCCVTDVDPRSGAITVGLSHGHFGPKLHRSDDGGRSYREVTTPAFAPEDGANVASIWALASDPRHPDGLWCGTVPGALFHSVDGGEEWRLVRSLWDDPTRERWFGGGTDLPALHTIEVDPRDPARILLGISCAGVWETEDGGESWRSIGRGQYAEYMPDDLREDPVVQDPHRIRRCAAAPDVLWMQHHNGVFRSTNGGHDWTECPSVDPSTFGFAIAADPHDPAVAWTIPGLDDSVRVACEGALCVSRTEDGGATWTALREGLPQEHVYDMAFRHALDISSDGRTLCFGTTSGNVYISEDRGERWETIGTSFAPVYSVEFCPPRPDPEEGPP